MRAAMFAVLGVVGLTACSVTPASEEGKAETAEAITTTSNTFVTLTADTRKCMAPLCGGYYITDVNRGTSPRYVSGLDFSASGLDSTTIDKITSAPVGEIVLRGHLGQLDSYGTQTLVVSEAYRGMPGMVVQATDNFFQVNPSTTNVTELNVQVLGPYVSTDTSGAAAPFTDQTVMQRQIGAYSAIVSGDATLSGWQWSTTMTAHQVFYKLPFHHGACPMYMVQNCQSPTVNTYTRNADMCMLGGACVTQQSCPLFRPGCQDGYTLHSWLTAPNGCAQYVCDPSFLN